MNPSLVPHSLNAGNEDTEGINGQILLGIAQREVVNVVQSHAATQQCEDDINELKDQLEERNKELARLRARVKTLETKNDELEVQLKSKCNEVTHLRERITKLENEKKTLEEELSTVKLSLKNIKEELSGLTKSNEAQEVMNVRLEGELMKVSKSLKDVEDDLEASQEHNKHLKQEIHQVKKQQRYVQGAPVRLPIQASRQSTAMKCLAEMACRILNTIYLIVLPDFYTPVINYSIQLLEEDIKKLPKTEQERKEARERWDEVKRELSWSDQQAEVLSLLQNSPSLSEVLGQEYLDEALLRNQTDYLRHENILKGRLEFESIKSLIEVWKKLNKRPSALKLRN